MHGFGWEEDGHSPRVMEHITVRGTPHGSCRAAWGALTHDNDLCAIGACEPTLGPHDLLCRDSCRGDSGGLLVHMPSGPNGADVRVYGVVSRGSRDCGRHAAHPGIYTSFERHAAFVGAALAADEPDDDREGTPDPPRTDDDSAAMPRASLAWSYIMST